MQMNPEKNSPTPPSVPFPSDLSVSATTGPRADPEAPHAAIVQSPVIPAAAAAAGPAGRSREIGGPAGPDPTRFGDWERKGRCIDF